MKVSKAFQLFVIAGSMSALVACSQGGGASYTSPDMGSNSSNQTKKSKVDSSSEQEQVRQTNDSSQDVLPQTVVPDPVVPGPVVQDPIVSEQQTIQERYPNWIEPSSAVLNDPTNTKIYNETNEGIVSVNGNRLALVVPPGEAAVIPKRFIDVNQAGKYRVNIVTDAGRTVQARFEASDVNMDEWRATLRDVGGSLVVQQNAGGGGGGGGGGGDDLGNFN